jgi:hypothetical protein
MSKRIGEACGSLTPRAERGLREREGQGTSSAGGDTGEEGGKYAD